MNKFLYCHIEQFADNLWYILFPDETKALSWGYKSLEMANEQLKILCGRV